MYSSREHSTRALFVAGIAFADTKEKALKQPNRIISSKAKHSKASLDLTIRGEIPQLVRYKIIHMCFADYCPLVETIQVG